MLITILTAGTRGDTQPFIALALGLQRAGHRVRLVGARNFATWVQGYGLDFFPLRINLTEMLNTADAQAIMEADSPLRGMVKQLRAVRSTVMMDDLQGDVWQACQDAEAIIYTPVVINGYFIARHLGIPSVMVSAFPISPTRYRPSALFYHGPHLGSAYNRFTHMVFDQLFWQTARPSVKGFWRRQNVDMDVPFMSPYACQRDERQPVLYGYSEHVLSRPADWPAHISVTGYWFLDPEADWQPPADLLDFIHSGPPPVYIGFGSMGNIRRAQETTAIVLRALALAGQRAVLASGWGGLSRDTPLPDRVFMVSDVPHGWLFPQMAAVVHHGGAGTTAAGLRAGVPSVVVPHGADQPMWGRRIWELGVGPQPVARKRLTAENLAAAIVAALQDDVRERAGTIGRRIRAEDGVARAVELVHHYIC